MAETAHGRTFDQRTSLVMIAYNEESHIARVVSSYYKEIYTRLPKGSEYIVYLDGSKDRTPQILQELITTETPELTLIPCAQNKGYSTAAKTALKAARNEWVFFSDSSGKHRAEDFWPLAAKAQESDIVNGFRSNREDPPYRRAISILQRSGIALLFGMPMLDANTGYKLMRKQVLNEILDQCDTLRLTLSTELIIRAYKAGYRISEVPVAFLRRPGREKAFAPRRLPRIFWTAGTDYLRLFAKLRLARKA